MANSAALAFSYDFLRRGVTTIVVSFSMEIQSITGSFLYLC